jgi:hypothetical protein
VPARQAARRRWRASASTCRRRWRRTGRTAARGTGAGWYSSAGCARLWSTSACFTLRHTVSCGTASLPASPRCSCDEKGQEQPRKWSRTACVCSAASAQMGVAGPRALHARIAGRSAGAQAHAAQARTIGQAELAVAQLLALLLLQRLQSPACLVTAQLASWNWSQIGCRAERARAVQASCREQARTHMHCRTAGSHRQAVRHHTAVPARMQPGAPRCSLSSPLLPRAAARAHRLLRPVAQQVAGGCVALHAQQRRVRLARHLAQLRVRRVLRHLRAAARPERRAPAWPAIPSRRRVGRAPPTPARCGRA